MFFLWKKQELATSQSRGRTFETHRDSSRKFSKPNCTKFSTWGTTAVLRKNKRSARILAPLLMNKLILQAKFVLFAKLHQLKKRFFFLAKFLIRIKKTDFFEDVSNKEVINHHTSEPKSAQFEHDFSGNQRIISDNLSSLHFTLCTRLPIKWISPNRVTGVVFYLFWPCGVTC